MGDCFICRKKAEHRAFIRKVTVPLCSLHFTAYKNGLLDKETLRSLAMLKLIRS